MPPSQPSGREARVAAMSVTDDFALSGPAFDALYAGKIEPQLKQLEIERRKSMRNAILIWLLFAASAASECLVWGLFTHGRTWIPDLRLLLPTVIAGFIGGFIPLGDITRKTKLALIHSFSDPLGLAYEIRPAEPPVVQRLADLGLLPKSDNRYFEDQFKGRRGQSEFTLCETVLNVGQGKNSRVVFKGQVFQVAFPRKFMGKTVMLRDSGWLNSFVCPEGLRKVGLEDPKYEALWEVFGDDQIESRAVLTPTFMEQMIALESVYAGKNIRCAFYEGDLMIAVEGVDRFEQGSMFSKLDTRERAQSMANDFAALIAVIDSVVPPTG